jgi:hypothetical protein
MVAKSSKKRKEADFLNDGLSSDDIKNIVQEIILYMTENKSKCSSHEELLNKMKQSIDGLTFFEERYPMLYAMVTKEEGFDYASLEYFLNMRNKIIKNELSVEEASKEVGQVWFDKYCKIPKKE